MVNFIRSCLFVCEFEQLRICSWEGESMVWILWSKCEWRVVSVWWSLQQRKIKCVCCCWRLSHLIFWSHLYPCFLLIHLLAIFCLISYYLLNSSRNFASLVATEFKESFVAHRTFHLSLSSLFCQSRFLHVRLLWCLWVDGKEVRYQVFWVIEEHQ